MNKRRNPGCGFCIQGFFFLPFIDFLAQKNYNITIAMHRNVKPKQSDGDCANEVLNDYGMMNDS